MSGGHFTVSRPTAIPMERLDLRLSMAGINIDRLGNASPRRLEIDVNMAGGNLDMRGAWRNDSDIRIDATRGGALVRLPRDTQIVGVPGRLGVSVSDEEIPPPTLRFQVKGDVEFD